MLRSEHLVGSWKLRNHSGFTGEPQGRLLYHPDGSMAVIIRGKVLKEGALVIHTLAYAGTFAMDGPYLVHDVEVSDNPTRVGVPQKRYATLEGHLLMLSEGPDSSGGFSITWERAR